MPGDLWANLRYDISKVRHSDISIPGISFRYGIKHWPRCRAGEKRPIQIYRKFDIPIYQYLVHHFDTVSNTNRDAERAKHIRYNLSKAQHSDISIPGTWYIVSIRYQKLTTMPSACRTGPYGANSANNAKSTLGIHLYPAVRGAALQSSTISDRSWSTTVNDRSPPLHLDFPRRTCSRPCAV